MSQAPPRSSIPIFPLSAVVLFPRVSAPLHIFEPRYRQMTAAALGGDRRIGMVTARPEYAQATQGDPPVFSVGCEGRITAARKLSDGRYYIVLLGTRRFRILSEPPRPAGRLYRVAEVEALEDRLDPRGAAHIAKLRPTVVALVRKLIERVDGGRAEALTPAQWESVDDFTFVNGLCQALDLPAPEKQCLLESDDVAERTERLVEILQFHVASRPSLGGSEAGTRH